MTNADNQQHYDDDCVAVDDCFILELIHYYRTYHHDYHNHYWLVVAFGDVATATIVAVGVVQVFWIEMPGIRSFLSFGPWSSGFFGQSVVLLLPGVLFIRAAFVASCWALSRSFSRTGRNASSNASTRLSVGPHRVKPTLFCSHTTIVPWMFFM